MTNNAPMVRLGNYIEECDLRNSNGDFGIKDVVGLNIDKNFIPTVANLQSTDLTKYKIVPSGYFACNLMHIGRDIRIPIAYNRDTKAQVVSPAYFVFCVKKTKEYEILDDYLSLLFSRYEFDRFCWFSTDCSIRGNLLTDRFCDIQIPLPSIETQRALVAIYDGLQKTIAENEALIKEIESVCHAFVVDCKTKYPKVKLGEWIEILEKRNSDGKHYPFTGVNKDKTFMPTAADTNELDNTKYKVVSKDMFVFSGMQTGRDICIRLALYTEETPILISPAYTTFVINDPSKLLPEYFFLTFCRFEMDRYGAFLSDGSIRSNLDWNRFCEIEIPLPPIALQRSIAEVFNCLQESKRIVQETRELMKNLCPALVQKAAHSA